MESCKQQVQCQRSLTSSWWHTPRSPPCSCPCSLRQLHCSDIISDVITLNGGIACNTCVSLHVLVCVPFCLLVALQEAVSGPLKIARQVTVTTELSDQIDRSLNINTGIHNTVVRSQRMWFEGFKSGKPPLVHAPSRLTMFRWEPRWTRTFSSDIRDWTAPLLAAQTRTPC